MTSFAEYNFNARRYFSAFVVAYRSKEPRRRFNVVRRVKRARSSRSRSFFTFMTLLFELGVFLLDMCGVEQNEFCKIESRRRSVNLPTKTVGNEFREETTVVQMRVR